MRIKQSKLPVKIILGIFYCIAIPLLLFLSFFVFRVRGVYLLSMGIAVLAALPAFVLYEDAKPTAQKVALVAIYTALIVASRAAFFWVPQIKPMMALVMLGGIAFGARFGFLVGVFSTFCSNFLFGQGPWTPFQMVAFGLAGFVTGLLFYKKDIAKKRWVLPIYGFVTTYVLYGGIMNFYSVAAFVPTLTWQAILLSYISAIPFDVAHAGGTALFLLVLSNMILKKTDRLKIKYGVTFE